VVGTSLSQTFNLTAVTQGISIVAGNNQGALVNQPFPTNLKVIVYDQNGNPVPGISVGFSVPGFGATSSFSGGGSNVIVPTGADGTATAPVLSANGTAGSFAAYASASPLSAGSTTTVSFNLTNYTRLNIVAGNNQSAPLNSVFATNLTVLVLDQNANPAPGVQVTFTVMGGDGASGTFAGSGTQAFVTTTANGTAVAPALTANGTVGAFPVVASAAGLNSQTFVLTNVMEGFAYGGNQTGVTTRTLPQPFIVQASAGATSGTIVYTVVPNGGAGGSFNGAVTATVNTDAQGYGTSPQLTANGTPGTFTVTAYDGVTTATTNVTSLGCMNPTSQTVTVGDASDNATDPGSLRYAVNNACTGSTVDLTQLTGTITLGSRLRIDDSLTINGPGAASLAIDGGKTTRLFFIGGGTVAINNLTLQNGLGTGGNSGPGGAAAGMGGAVYMNGGSVTVSGVTFSGNEALGGTASYSSGFGGGGGGFGGNAGNNTNQYQGLGGSGGDLFGLGGSADSQVGANGGPGAGGAGGYYQGGNGGFGGGGGAATTAPSGQTSSSGSGGFGAGGGGGFSPSGNTVMVLPGTGGFGGAGGFIGTNSTAPIGGGGAGFGGAIFEYAGTLTLQNDQFLNNSSVGGTGYTGQNNGQGKGGALFIYNGATAVDNGSIFGVGTGAANIAADAGSPGIGNSAGPYVNGATCPGQDTVDVCGALIQSQTITFAAIAPQSVNTTLPLSASATSGLPVSFASSTPLVCTVSGTAASLIAGGTCTIVATQAGNAAYAPATPVTHSFPVQRVPQTITFAPLPNQPFGTAPFAVTATASSGLTVRFASTTASTCTVSGDTVTLVAVGRCVIRATQPGGTMYAPAAPVTQGFQVTKEAQTITFSRLANHKIGTPPFTVTATASSGLAVSFVSDTTTTCTVSGNTVTLVAVGQCDITAKQPGNATYSAAPPVTRVFQIEP
jgi:hypothetical protein